MSGYTIAVLGDQLLAPNAEDVVENAIATAMVGNIPNAYEATVVVGHGQFGADTVGYIAAGHLGTSIKVLPPIANTVEQQATVGYAKKAVAALKKAKPDYILILLGDDTTPETADVVAAVKTLGVPGKTIRFRQA